MTTQIEIRHLQLIAAVADTGSLTRAAEVLHLTQSALSHQLREIEHRLRTPLFHRAGKRMVLTHAGTRVLETARRVLDDLTQAEDDVRNIADDRRGVLRLSTQCYTCYHWLPSLMREFAERHPQVELFVDIEATCEPEAALLSGRLDVALMSGEIDDPRLRAVDLFEDEVLVIVSPDHRFNQLDYVSAADLATQTLVTYSGLDDHLAYRRVLKPANLAPRKHLQVRLTEAMVEMVKAKMGVAVLARWAVTPYLATKTVSAIPLTRDGLRRQWKGVTLASARVRESTADFLRLVAAKGRQLSIAAVRETPSPAARERVGVRAAAE